MTTINFLSFSKAVYVIVSRLAYCLNRLIMFSFENSKKNAGLSVKPFIDLSQILSC